MNMNKEMGIVVIANGKILNSDNGFTLVNVFDDGTPHKAIIGYMNMEFAKKGAKVENVMFSKPLDFDDAISLVEEKSQMIEAIINQH